jgi:hypothetical protein
VGVKMSEKKKPQDYIEEMQKFLEIDFYPEGISFLLDALELFPNDPTLIAEEKKIEEGLYSSERGNPAWFELREQRQARLPHTSVEDVSCTIQYCIGRNHWARMARVLIDACETFPDNQELVTYEEYLIDEYGYYNGKKTEFLQELERQGKERSRRKMEGNVETLQKLERHQEDDNPGKEEANTPIAIQAFPTKPNNWEEFTIYKIDGESVSFQVKEKAIGRFKFNQIEGFFNKSKRIDSNIHWKILLEFAGDDLSNPLEWSRGQYINSGICTSEMSKKEKEILTKYVTAIDTILKRLTGLSRKPIPFDRGFNAYKPRFKIEPIPKESDDWARLSIRKTLDSHEEKKNAE